MRLSSRPRHGNHGFVLIVVLAILAILALLGITFVTLSSVERDVSRTYLDDTRARFAASSGIEYGLVRIREVTESANGPMLVTPVTRSLIYFGNQMDETQSPDIVTPLKNAKNPSFAVEANAADMTDNPADTAAYDPTPKIIRVNGTDVGYSGAFESGTYGKDCDTYSLRITDANGRIYVNDGLGNPGVTANLKRILNILGDQPAVGVSGLGTLLINSRPPKGYQSYYDLRKLFSNQADYDRVRNFVTIYAWVDTKVVNPVPLSPDVIGDYLVPYQRPVAALTPRPPSYPVGWTGPMYRYGRQVNYMDQPNTTSLTWGSNIYGWDELNPQYIEVASRAPVNINIAPREVLIALLQDIQGFFVMETPRGTLSNEYTMYGSSHSWDDSLTGPSSWIVGTSYSMIGTVYKTLKVETSGTGPSTSALADKIIANRNKRLGTGDITQPYHGPFTSWAQFNLFMDSLVADGTIVDTRFTGLQQTFASQAMADAIKANFNPNLHLNEINPDENLNTLVDKTDLLVNSTEFCFTYRGIFEIQSVGRILKPRGGSNYDLVAERTVECVVKLYDVYREGTQSDFYRGEITIDDGGGGTLTEAEAHTGYRTNNNRSLETGPEPDNGLAPSENEYEGYVRLSTIGGDLPVSTTSSSPVAGLKHKPKGHVWETPWGSQAFGENIHAHYSFDFDLHYAVASLSTANPYNVALYKTTTSASSTYSTTPQSNAVDGGEGTAWQVSTGSNAWFKVDLGQAYTVNQVYVSAAWAFPSGSYSLFTSSNGTTFTQRGVALASTGGPYIWTLTPSVANVRWVQINIANASFTAWYPHICELQVIRDDPGYVLPPVGDSRRRALTRNWNRGTSVPGLAQTFYNYADWSEKNADGSQRVVGPYSVSETPGIIPWAQNVGGLRDYRIARSFRLPPAVGEIVPPVTGAFYAPSDLRADGGYMERHSAAVYWPGNAVDYTSTSNSNIYTWSGTAGFWVKPGFHPELAGKYRTFFSHSKMWYRVGMGSSYINYTTFNPMCFALFYLPNNDLVVDNGNFTGGEPGNNRTALRSFGWGFSYSKWAGLSATSVNQVLCQGGWQTNTVNHVGHADDNVTNNKFKAHRWTFVTLRWNTALADNILINGTPWGVKPLFILEGPMSAFDASEWNRAGTSTVLNTINPVRLGEPSILVPPTSAATPSSTETPSGSNANLKFRNRNFAADSTIDEFYIWNTNTTGETQAKQNQWEVGRYYRHNDGRFTSGDIALNLDQDRALPPPSLTEVLPPSEIPPRKVRLIGISWTQYAETSASSGNNADPLRYVMYDYKNWSSDPTAAPDPLTPRLEFKVSGDGAASWSPIVLDSRWNKLDVAVSDPTKVKYSVKFATQTIGLNEILLTTPVLDDVLLYFQTGGPVFLEYTAF